MTLRRSTVIVMRLTDVCTFLKELVTSYRGLVGLRNGTLCDRALIQRELALDLNNLERPTIRSVGRFFAAIQLKKLS